MGSGNASYRRSSLLSRIYDLHWISSQISIVGRFCLPNTCWAAEEGQASFHGCANQNHPPMRYTHARKRLSEPSEREKGVHRFTSKREISCPNRETDTEASIILHLNMKYPVRTIRCLPSRQWFTSKHEISCPNNEKYTEASTVYI